MNLFEKNNGNCLTNNKQFQSGKFRKKILNQKIKINFQNCLNKNENSIMYCEANG